MNPTFFLPQISSRVVLPPKLQRLMLQLLRNRRRGGKSRIDASAAKLWQTYLHSQQAGQLTLAQEQLLQFYLAQAACEH